MVVKSAAGNENGPIIEDNMHKLQKVILSSWLRIYATHPVIFRGVFLPRSFIITVGIPEQELWGRF